MNENEIAKEVVDTAIQVHRNLGPGLLETVYEQVLSYELTRRKLKVQRQVSIPIEYEGIKFEEGFRADIIVDGKVIIEIKSVEQICGVHKKQLQTYLRLSKKKLGLLLNFNAELMKEGIVRVVNQLQENFLRK